MQQKLATYFPYFLAGLTILVWLIIICYPISQGIFPMTFDQGRDFLWVKNQVDLHKLYLVGPWGSLSGVFFGPLWFWLLTIPYIISNGNPVILTYFNTLLIFVTSVLIYVLLRKKAPYAAYFALLLAFLAPGMKNIAGFAFSQHLLPLLTLFLIYSLTQILISSSKTYFYLSLLFISLIFHAEPPTSAASLAALPLIIAFSPKKKQLLHPKTLLIGALAFLIPFLPQIAFDIRHDFIQTKSIIAYTQGNNESLGGVLPLPQRIPDRFIKFTDKFNLISILNLSLIPLIWLIVTGAINFKLQKEAFSKALWKTVFLYIISLFFAFILYPPELKAFYLEGLMIPFIIWQALALAYMWKNNLLRICVILFLIVVFMQNMQLGYFIKETKTRYADITRLGSIFRNQKEIIDWIYFHADGKGFNAYTYSPAIYDFPNQYMFFWRGLNTYQYLPAEFAYLPNSPEYVQDKSLLLTKYQNTIKKPEYIFLIIDAENHAGYTKSSWLQHFPENKYPLLLKKTFLDSTIVEKRQIK